MFVSFEKKNYSENYLKNYLQNEKRCLCRGTKFKTWAARCTKEWSLKVVCSIP